MSVYCVISNKWFSLSLSPFFLLDIHFSLSWITHERNANRKWSLFFSVPNVVAIGKKQRLDLFLEERLLRFQVLFTKLMLLDDSEWWVMCHFLVQIPFCTAVGNYLDWWWGYRPLHCPVTSRVRLLHKNLIKSQYTVRSGNLIASSSLDPLKIVIKHSQDINFRTCQYLC